MKDTIVLGRGFLGNEFQRQGYEVYSRREFIWPCELDTLERYNTIINCIGIADTRGCERAENWPRVMSVNTTLVGALSDYCQSHGKKLVHISTGCVYDQNNSPQNEDSFTEKSLINPSNPYSATKAAAATTNDVSSSRTRTLLMHPA